MFEIKVFLTTAKWKLTLHEFKHKALVERYWKPPRASWSLHYNTVTTWWYDVDLCRWAKFCYSYRHFSEIDFCNSCLSCTVYSIVRGSLSTVYKLVEITHTMQTINYKIFSSIKPNLNFFVKLFGLTNFVIFSKTDFGLE